VSLPQLGELSGARDQMERLLWVVVGLASDLEVNATLHRIVTAAMELTGAGYGAVGVLGADGHLISFVDSGIDEATVARWGKFPSARGCWACCSTNPNKRCVSTIKQAFYARLAELLGELIALRAEDLAIVLTENDRPDCSFGRGEASMSSTQRGLALTGTESSRGLSSPPSGRLP
jgi:hypothetical protein